MDKLGNCRDCTGTCKLNHHTACNLQAVSAGNQRNTGCGENRNRKLKEMGPFKKSELSMVIVFLLVLVLWILAALQHRRNHNRIDRFGRSIIITGSDLG